MRWTQFYLPTLRETPADAEVISHRLLLKAGMIRKLAAGIYTQLPLGLRSIRKLERIVREEMDRAGALEIAMPAVQPAELWLESGRWQVYGPELLRLKDRHGRDFCFGPTHEEVVVDLVRHELRSYRDLPRNFYQIQTKFRDEIRPRFGLMRGREFVMKDAYSFDADEAGLERSFAAMEQAYRRIFSRCGLRFKMVEADSGNIGGDVSYEFHVLAQSGEDAVASCTGCDWAANVEKAEALPGPPAPAEPPLPFTAVSTPGRTTVEEVAAFLGVPPSRLIKTLIVEVDGGAAAAVLVRGDHTLSEVKLGRFLGKPWRFADAARIEQLTGAPVGFSGPLGITGVTVLADRSVEGTVNAVVGANRADTHLLDVSPGRDFAVTAYADLRSALDGDPCPRCAAALVIVRGIEVGHIFKLRSKYSAAMKATFLDEGGQERNYVMGCYGLGIGRTLAAAVEQNHDLNGIIWPLPLAPFEVLVTVLNPDDAVLVATATRLAGELEGRGVEVLLDDRNERAGVKFKDADLIGIPLRLVLGSKSFKDGNVEISLRRGGDKRLVAVAQAVAVLLDLRDDLASEHRAG